MVYKRVVAVLGIFVGMAFSASSHATDDSDLSVRSRGRVEALSSAECLQLLKPEYGLATRNYRKLRRLLENPELDEATRKFLSDREYQRAIWTLRRKGLESAALDLRLYLEDSLREAHILRIWRLNEGVTGSYVVELQGGIKAIFKPEIAHWGYRDRELPNPVGEILAYEFDIALGSNLVPATVERVIGGIKGTLQVWVEHAEHEPLIPYWYRNQEVKEKLRSVFLFDYLIQNRDRHVGNYMILDGHPVAIDHGDAFISPSEPRLAIGIQKENVLDGLAIPKEFYEGLRDHLTESMIDRLCLGKVSDETIQQIKRRRQEILEYHQDFTP